MNKTFGSASSHLKAIEEEIENLNHQAEQLQETMVLYLFLDTDGNKRQQFNDGRSPDRRVGERRTPERAVPGRRTLSDRRVPMEERWPELSSQLSQLVEQSVALHQKKQELQSYAQ